MDTVQNVGAALRDARNDLGWSAAQLAERAVDLARVLGDEEFSLTQQAVSYFEAGKQKAIPRWLNYARQALKDAGGSDDRFVAAGAIRLPIAGGTRRAVTGADAAEELDLVPIAVIDLQYGMGAAYIDNPVAEDLQYFPRWFIEAITSSPPQQLTLAQPQGDSMEPTIRGGGDFVIIDRSERAVRSQDVIWAFTVGDIGMIKRLRVRGRRVLIQSDNPNVSDDEADVEEVNIVGRVIFVGRRV